MEIHTTKIYPSIELIKKEIYKQDPEAELHVIRNERLIYMCRITLSDIDYTITFTIPFAEAAGAILRTKEPAKFLIRWMETAFN